MEVFASKSGFSIENLHVIGAFPNQDPRPYDQSYDQNLEVGLLADRVLEATRHFKRDEPRSVDIEAFNKANSFLNALLELEDADLDSMLERSLNAEQLGSYSVSLTSAIQFVPQPTEDLFDQIRDLKTRIDTGLENRSLSEENAGELMEFFGKISQAMLADDAQRWARRDT